MKSSTDDDWNHSNPKSKITVTTDDTPQEMLAYNSRSTIHSERKKKEKDSGIPNTSTIKERGEETKIGISEVGKHERRVISASVAA